MALNEFLSEIANAIRQKKGTSSPIKATNFANEILSIQGGGGSSDLIDVTKLPTTVDDSKIYRVKSSIKANAYICFDNYIYDLAIALSIVFGQSIQLNYIIVDKLPQTGTEGNGNVVDAYILTTNNTGYLWVGSGGGWWSDFADIANGLVENGNFQNKGSIDSVNNIKEDGIYIVYTRPTEIGVPNENNDKKVLFWNGKSWGYENKVVELDGENLPEVGVEGTIYFRKNVPVLLINNEGKVFPYIELLLYALGGVRICEHSIIANTSPTFTPSATNVPLIPVVYVTNGSLYRVYIYGSDSWTEMGDFGTSVNNNLYISIRNEVWYFINGKYVRISPDEMTETADFDYVENAEHYVGDLDYIKINLTKRSQIVSGIEGELKRGDFTYETFENYQTVRTGALAGCTGVTSIERLYVNNALNVNLQLQKDIIGDAAFYGCTGLTTVDIVASDGIGKHAFYGCTNLQSVYVYGANIGEYAFANCTSLKDIHFNGTKAEWNAGTFGRGWNENTGNYTVHCTDGDIAKS